MDTFIGLRRFVHVLKKKIRIARRTPGVFDPGIPPGIDLHTLENICQEYFDEHVLTTTYQHLSGWKAAGAFRILIKTNRGSERTLIFKDAFYATEQIPALVDLPLLPGSPEYVIYSQPDGPLKPYLPTVYLAEEVTPGSHYRFVLEDLARSYHIPIDDSDVLRISKQLPRLHLALADWAANANTQGLLRYGKDFSQALQEYVRINLENYTQQYNDPTVNQLVKVWPAIAALHMRPEFFSTQFCQPIHGDTNYTNIHLHKQNRDSFKIVDWEWAGFAPIYADLASLLKGTPKEIEKRAFNKFSTALAEVNPCLKTDFSPEEHHRQYLWCQLERGLLDAGFLAAQTLYHQHQTAFSLPAAVRQSAERVLLSYRQLAQ